MSSAAALNQRLQHLHREVQALFPAISRVAVALYDDATDELRTFLYSPADATPLAHYRVRLAEAGWLDQLQRERRSRVLDDLSPSVLGTKPHSRRIAAVGFKSSYTVPIYDDERFVGFVFFNADRSDCFDASVTAQLDLFVTIISLMVERTLQTAATLSGGVHLLGQISKFRNDETGSHLNRMAYYSELIARELAGGLGRDDDWVEHVRLFAPMHDIGKLTTPDAVLLKPGKLSDSEFEVMRQHPIKGEAILKSLLRELDLEQMPYVDSLLHIARHHHERWDGTGYPDRLCGTDIPVEARITAVADVFDALTTTRCYKEAWPFDHACAFLEEQADRHFDPQCVRVFLAHLDEIRRIHDRFPPAPTAPG
ncbi:MAG: HD domain-containing protein [Nevskiales bacterium]|nr:HD domain-containing protein [Nevskiales bacterium]